MDRFCLWIFAISFLSSVLASVNITELLVPESISIDGNITYADFDCIYESFNETGLEVKWFINGNYHQIYQWIPGYKTRGSPMGLLKDRLDLTYAVTDDSDTKYRGFRINNISQQLSGNYTCKISTDSIDVEKTKQMIIYSPADTGLEMILLNDAGLVVCSVYGISPLPQVSFYIFAKNGSYIDIDKNVDPSEPDKDGLYNVTATHDFSEYNNTLKGPVKFVCNMSIPGTSYFLTKEIVHLAEEEKPELNVTEVTFNETVARNEIPLEIIVGTTPRGNSAVHPTFLIYFLLISVLLAFCP